MQKILIVEDDPEIAKAVSERLKQEHYEVQHCDNGQIGLERLKSEVYDLAILDWELPGLSGIEICKRYRIAGGAIPILMLTGRESIADRTTGLDTGADDYLVKPFSLQELAARVRALLRRPTAVASNLIELGPLKLDTVKHRISKNGVEIQLMPRDFSLLEFFMRNPEQVFSSEALLLRVWNNDSDVGPDALRTSIKRLRKKLDAGADESRSMIENVPRVGYRLRIPASQG